MTRRPFPILAQPDDTTCGPTCLHAVYRHYGDRSDLAELIAEVQPLETGGTLAVYLAHHALRRGYRATIYTYNLQLFDPTWFVGDVDLAAKLCQQAEEKRDARVLTGTQAYLSYLEMGGELRYQDLTPDLLRHLLRGGAPVLTGVSATYLYGCRRELDDQYDDVRGVPAGHFVILAGLSDDNIRIADPLANNPRFGGRYYELSMARVIGAILLGIVTYDANLLVIEPAHVDTDRR